MGGFMNQDNWLWGFDQFIQCITTPKEEINMKMKNYAVTIEVSGTITVFVSAPDDSEAEEIAFEEAQNQNWNDWELDLEVNGSEEEGYDDE
jgi:L-lactate utilization protein LutC